MITIPNINIIIDDTDAVSGTIVSLALINVIGIWAAAISTAASYFAMMMYRYFDLKKYMKITFDKKAIMSIIGVFAVAFAIYYYNNLYLNIVSFVLSIVYSYLLNRNFIKTGVKTILRKFHIVLLI